MKKRVIKYELLFNNIERVISSLEKSIDEFKSIEADIKKLDKYYGSKNWYKDIKEYGGTYNAGVLSEDGIWNLLERINYLTKEFNNDIIK